MRNRLFNEALEKAVRSSEKADREMFSSHVRSDAAYRIGHMTTTAATSPSPSLEQMAEGLELELGKKPRFTVSTDAPTGGDGLGDWS